jgi:hypothetical protein
LDKALDRGGFGSPLLVGRLPAEGGNARLALVETGLYVLAAALHAAANACWRSRKSWRKATNGFELGTVGDTSYFSPGGVSAKH